MLADLQGMKKTPFEATLTERDEVPFSSKSKTVQVVSFEVWAFFNLVSDSAPGFIPAFQEIRRFFLAETRRTISSLKDYCWYSTPPRLIARMLRLKSASSSFLRWLFAPRLVADTFSFAFACSSALKKRFHYSKRLAFADWALEPQASLTCLRKRTENVHFI